LRILKNTYYLMRHGKSRANEMGIILSNPTDGILPKWGLTEEGIEQVRLSILNSRLPENTLIYCSDFSRAWETALILAEMKNLKLRKTELLRERYFGSLDKGRDDLYKSVWAGDNDPDNNENGVESPEEVYKRTSSLILILENKYKDQNIVLVSHGDALQILQTWFQEEPVTDHRKLTHLETAELRPLLH